MNKIPKVYKGLAKYNNPFDDPTILLVLGEPTGFIIRTTEVALYFIPEKKDFNILNLVCNKKTEKGKWFVLRKVLGTTDVGYGVNAYCTSTEYYSTYYPAENFEDALSRCNSLINKFNIKVA